jgi:iron transport multicopper oxidase
MVNEHLGHIEWHLEVGLAVQIIEAQQRASSLPQEVADQCKILKDPASGNAAGHASTTDLSGWYLGPFRQRLGWLPKGTGAMAG